MSSKSYEVLRKNRADISKTIVARLKTSGAVHYQTMEKGVRQRRVDILVDTFLRSMKNRPGVFINYLKKIAEERIPEGIFLHEIQIALQILEEKSWQLIVENVPQAEQVRCLSQITGTVGAAKDQLAHVYLQHLEKAEMNAAFLKGRLDAMAKGTDCGPVVEEVWPPAGN